MGPYLRDGLATVERVEWDQIMGPEIRINPANVSAASVTIDSLVDWIAVSVEFGNLELFIDGDDWDEVLANYLQSVVEGGYREIGQRTRFGPGVKMIFGQSDGDDLTYTVGGIYRGAEQDYPPGERRYSPYG